MATGFSSPEGEGFSEADHFARWEIDMRLGNLTMHEVELAGNFAAWDQQMETGQSALEIGERVMWLFTADEARGNVVE